MRANCVPGTKMLTVADIEQGIRVQRFAEILLEGLPSARVFR
jgi:hypothetical protein